MPQLLCRGHTAAGNACTYIGVMFESYCRTHHRIQLRNDPAYSERYNTYMQGLGLAPAHAPAQGGAGGPGGAAGGAGGAAGGPVGAVPVLVPAHRPPRIVVPAAQPPWNAAERANIIEKNTRLLESIPNIPIHRIQRITRRLMELWRDNAVAGYTIPQAYGALTYMNVTHAGFADLLRAATTVTLQANGNHPDHARYRDVPLEERQRALTALQTALTPYGNTERVWRVGGDPFLQDIQDRIHREQEEARRAEVAAAAAAARAAAHAQLQQDLRERPVVFQRDPEGSINLVAFATDDQNIHRSSVQNETQQALRTLLDRPVPEDQETLAGIITQFNTGAVIWFGPNARERAITEITNDYYLTEAFSVPYGAILDRVWAFIASHIHKDDLVIRLAQEVCEGIGMCTNGKMARLVNVLQGYDETLLVQTETPREIFQRKIAMLMKQPMAERERAAQSLFTEFNIPSEEQTVWLEPLLVV